MSERESAFIKWFAGVSGVLVAALILSAFSFHLNISKSISVQQEVNKNADIRSAINAASTKALELRFETSRIEWREDIKEIKMNIDKIQESQARIRNYK